MQDLEMVRSGVTNHWTLHYKDKPLGVVSMDVKNHIPGHHGMFLSFRSFPGKGEDAATIVAIKQACRMVDAKVVYTEVADHDSQRINLLMKAGFSEVLDNDELDNTVLVWLRP